MATDFSDAVEQERVAGMLRRIDLLEAAMMMMFTTMARVAESLGRAIEKLATDDPALTELLRETATLGATVRAAEPGAHK